MKNWKPVKKVLAGLLAGVTATGVVAALHAVGVNVGPEVGAAVVTVAGFAAAWLAPREKPAP